MNGVPHYFWRAVAQYSVVLDILVQEKRDGAAAKRFFNRLPRGHCQLNQVGTIIGNVHCKWRDLARLADPVRSQL
jgi:transposase-like protein